MEERLMFVDWVGWEELGVRVGGECVRFVNELVDQGRSFPDFGAIDVAVGEVGLGLYRGRRWVEVEGKWHLVKADGWDLKKLRRYHNLGYPVYDLVAVGVICLVRRGLEEHNWLLSRPVGDVRAALYKHLEALNKCREGGFGRDCNCVLSDLIDLACRFGLSVARGVCKDGLGPEVFLVDEGTKEEYHYGEWEKFSYLPEPRGN